MVLVFESVCGERHCFRESVTKRVRLFTPLHSSGRQLKEGDEIATGLAGNRITQRLKLNEQVALVTGNLLERLSGGERDLQLV